MKVEIRMPEVAADITVADLVGWLAAPGDRVSEGDILLEIETDKSTVEIEAPATGVLSEIRIPAGTSDVPVGQILGVIETSESVGSDIGTAAPSELDPKPTAEQDAPSDEALPNTGEGTEPGPPEPMAQAADGPARPATALARRLAERAGLNLNGIRGSGAHGRVLREDIDRELDSDSPAAAPLAKAGNTDSAQHDPGPNSPIEPIRVGGTYPLDPLLDILERLNLDHSTEPITLEAGLIRAVALALTEFPQLWPQDQSEGPASAHPTLIHIFRGSGEPGSVVEGAENRGLRELSALLATTSSDRDASTTRFGFFQILDQEVDWVEPTFQSSQICIIGVGSPRVSPLVKDGEIVVGTTLDVNLSVDTNVVDPGLAARLLQAFGRILASPLSMCL